MFKNNLGLKLFALLLAVIVWIQLSLLSEHQSVVKLKIELSNAKAAPTLAKEIGSVPFNVRGRGIDILKLKLSKTVAQFDARDIVGARESSSGLDFVIKDKPANLDIEILGVLKGFELGTVKPGRINPAGNEGLAGFTSSRKASPDPISKKATGHEPSSTMVLENIGISSPGGIQFLPSSATLKVSGKQSSLETLPRGLAVSAEDKPDASGTYELSVRLPAGVELVDITPKRVRIRK